MAFPNPFRLFWSWVVHTVARARGYEIHADTVTQDLRQHECNRCPFQSADGWQCNKCGCLLIAKISLALEKCPDKRWGRIWRKRKYAAKT